MIAIIGDIIKSKELKDRGQVQKKLNSIIDRINVNYQPAIVSKFSITLGDEFQGLLSSGMKCIQIIDELSFFMQPVQFRFGLGIGEISTEINTQWSIGTDGPAFWAARKAVNYVHDHNDYGRANIHLESQIMDGTVDLINQAIKLMAIQVSGWRETQRQVYQALLEKGIDDPKDIDHTQLAEHLGISLSSLTRRFESSGIKRYMEARKSVGEAIDKINVQVNS